MAKLTDTYLAIFAKAPVPGTVKTRMQPVLSEAQSAHLQQQLITRSLNTAEASPEITCSLWCAPDANHPSFQTLAETRPRYFLKQQQGEDLGARMQQAFQQGLQQYQKMILIGTDCPLLTSKHIQAVQQALDTYEVVLIGATDGGYVLIAGRTVPPCFSDIEWGTEKVLQQTEKALKSHQINYSVLSYLPDLDRPDDLEALPEDIRDSLGV